MLEQYNFRNGKLKVQKNETRNKSGPEKSPKMCFLQLCIRLFTMCFFAVHGLRCDLSPNYIVLKAKPQVHIMYERRHIDTERFSSQFVGKGFSVIEYYFH